MRDFKEFIEKKIAVSCSSAKENIDFVNLCCSNGFKLGYPDYMDRFDKNKLWTVGRIFKDEIFNDNNNKSFLSEYKIVQASEFLQPQTTIEIFQAKQTVVCLKKEDGKVIARGVAKCIKDDVFNFDYGADLAFKRMVDSYATKVYYEKVKQHGLPKCFHIKGDAVDAVLPKIKILKDGIKIIKQDSYEVGDVILFKKDLIPVGCLRTATITETSDAFLFRFGAIGWYSINRIKGKVIE